MSGHVRALATVLAFVVVALAVVANGVHAALWRGGPAEIIAGVVTSLAGLGVAVWILIRGLSWAFDDGKRSRHGGNLP